MLICMEFLRLQHKDLEFGGSYARNATVYNPPNTETHGKDSPRTNFPGTHMKRPRLEARLRVGKPLAEVKNAEASSSLRK